MLLLRFCLAVALLYFAGLSNSSETIVLVQSLISAGGGLFLLAGLWTPLVAALVALDEFSVALLRHGPQEEHTHFFLAILAISAAMLGPGAFSVDARLFGRKRFDIDRRRGERPSL